MIAPESRCADAACPTCGKRAEARHELLTFFEVAEILRCDAETVERRAKANLFPVVRHGRKVLVHRSDLYAYIERCRQRWDGRLARPRELDTVPPTWSTR